MDVKIFGSDSDEESTQECLKRKRQPRIFKERIDYMEILNDNEFEIMFRLNKCAVLKLLTQIDHKISSATSKNFAISSLTKLLLTLKYFATGIMLANAGDFFGVSETSASVVIKTVTEAIASLATHYITMPQTAKDILNVQLGFYDLAYFPKVVGAIDTLLVEIECPRGIDSDPFQCSKGYYAWKVQIVCDSNLLIRDIVPSCPGLTTEKNIFNNSKVKEKFEDGTMEDSILLGNHNYKVTPYFMVPLVDVVSPEEVLYNKAHEKTSSVTKKCYDIWKKRFPVIALCIRGSYERSMNITVATAVLHNLAITEKLKLLPNEESVQDSLNEAEKKRKEVIDQMEQIEPKDQRNDRMVSIINDYFKLLLNYDGYNVII